MEKRRLPVMGAVRIERREFLWVGVAAGAAACGPVMGGGDAGGGDDAATAMEASAQEAGVEGGVDAGVEGGVDAGPGDVGIEAASETGVDAAGDAAGDAARDAGGDAGDAAMDAASDGATEAGVDAGAEAGVDASSEAGAEAGVDAAGDTAEPSDAPVPSGPACGARARSVGPVSRFAVGSATLISSGPFHVVRDARGVYAVTAVCTHAGCTVAAGGPGFACPCHGSGFTIEGELSNGPASSPLVNYLVCVNPDGTLGVDTTMTVPQGTRLAV